VTNSALLAVRDPFSGPVRKAEQYGSFSADEHILSRAPVSPCGFADACAKLIGDATH
jgi:hypothetical protein